MTTLAFLANSFLSPQISLRITLAFLLLAPILLLAGIAVRGRFSRKLFILAFVVMLLGTGSAYVRALSPSFGQEVTWNYFPNSGVIQAGGLDESPELLFSAFTLVLGLFLFVPQFVWGKANVEIPRSVVVGFLVFYLVALSVFISPHQSGSAASPQSQLPTKPILP